MITEEKVKRARRGDDNAFYELIQDRKEAIYRTAFMYVKNKEDALDIVNEAVYKAYISIGKLKEPRFFNTWLMRILINCTMDYINKSKKAIPLNQDINAPEELEARSAEEIMDLYQAVDKLEGKCKSVIILKYFQDMTLSQAAEVMGCPVGTAKTYLHKALKELRLELKEEW